MSQGPQNTFKVLQTNDHILSIVISRTIFANAITSLPLNSSLIFAEESTIIRDLNHNFAEIDKPIKYDRPLRVMIIF